MVALASSRTALVLIDLQRGVLERSLAPLDASEVLEHAMGLAEVFRGAGSPVVLVRVAFAHDFADAPGQPVDQPTKRPEGGMPPEWSLLADGLEQPGDLVVTKRQWGAFTGTELDLQLRRRGIDTIVLGGIATNFGVESTARHAWELGYAVVLARDLCTSTSRELHDMAMRHVLPRIARVVESADIELAPA